VAPDQAAKLLARCPTLVMLSPATVEAKVAAIAALLMCTPEQASAVVGVALLSGGTLIRLRTCVCWCWCGCVGVGVGVWA